jgi:hypothetical protein
VNATVTLSYTGMSGSPISLTTDSVGNWGPVLLPAPVQWTANASLYGGTGSTTFTTQLGGTVSASVQLNSPGTPNSIVGHVTFIGKLAPAINAQVTLSPGGLTTTADSSGTYSFSPLSDGTYTLQASWNGYTAGPSVTQSVSAGAVATVDLTAYGSEFINTLVLSSGGTAVEGAVLTYSYPGIPAPPASDTTDSSGRVYKYLEAPRTWTITATYGGSTGSVTITTSPGSVTSATIHLSP